MRIEIDITATTDDCNYGLMGRSTLRVDIPSHTCFMGVGDCVNLAIERAIELHNGKLAELKGRAGQEKPDDGKPDFDMLLH